MLKIEYVNSAFLIVELVQGVKKTNVWLVLKIFYIKLKLENVSNNATLMNICNLLCV